MVLISIAFFKLLFLRYEVKKEHFLSKKRAFFVKFHGKLQKKLGENDLKFYFLIFFLRGVEDSTSN